GIGKYLAEYYVAKGCRVFGCSRSAGSVQHEKYTHFEVDVCDEPGAQRMFAEIRSTAGGLDILINNAGIASMNSAFATPIRAVQRILSTNVTGTFLFCREAAKLMMKQRWGRIVNFATVATPLQLEGEAIYAASKAAVCSLNEILAREFAPFGI